MWLATNRGWYSVVSYDPARDTTGRKLQGKPPYVLVRARVKEHLTHVKAQMPSVRIETDDRADYRYRMVVPVKVWKKFLAAETDRINYINFKNSVKDNALHSAYTRVWGIMFDLQPRRFFGLLSGRGFGKKASLDAFLDDYEGPDIGSTFEWSAPLEPEFEDGCDECGCRQDDHEDGKGECFIKGCGCPQYIDPYTAEVRDTHHADIRVLNDMTTGRRHE